jgi:NTE family protein
MKLKVGFALGGGGVRGLASIGVLKALLESGIIPDVIAGTSMGAIVGSLYADSTDIALVESTITNMLASEEFRQKVHRLSSSEDMDRGFLDRIFETAKKGYFFYRFLFKESVVSAEAFFTEIDRIIPDRRFSELKIPFACMALDIVSGYPQILHSGMTRQAVKASSAVPGILPPVAIDGMMCIDGGWAESVPISAARVLGAGFVIGVDVSRETAAIDYKEEIKNSMDILFRADDITRSIMNTLRTRDADFIINPVVGDAQWSEFEDIDTYITAGYQAGVKAIPGLKKALRTSRIKALLWMKR